jgi:hypothetical protein
VAPAIEHQKSSASVTFKYLQPRVACSWGKDVGRIRVLSDMQPAPCHPLWHNHFESGRDIEFLTKNDGCTAGFEIATRRGNNLPGLEAISPVDWKCAR